MKRIVATVVALFSVTLVACASQTVPDQQTGVIAKQMTAQQADALQKEISEDPAHCHGAYASADGQCTISPPDASGNVVVYFADVDCNNITCPNAYAASDCN